jgi:hypothetical protein
MIAADQGQDPARFVAPVIGRFRHPPMVPGARPGGPQYSRGVSQHLRVFDYVNHPYDAVRDALVADPLAIFLRATSAAAARADALSAELRARIGPIEVGADIDIQVISVEDGVSPLDAPSTRITLDWKASRSPGLFPVMRAVLSVYALSPTVTQLDLEGDYEPPLGPLGRVIDAAIGHRVAEASVHRFIEQVASHLRDAM